MNPRSATDVLMSYMKSPRYTAKMVRVGGKEYACEDIPADQAAMLGQELDALMNWDSNPRIAEMVMRGAPRILDSVRMVNNFTHQGYGGAQAKGQQLVVNPMSAYDILKYNTSSVTLSGNSKGDAEKWIMAIAAAAASAWSGTSTYNNQMLVSSLPHLAHVFLGFIDPVEVPKVDMVQFIKDGATVAREYLTLGWRETFGTNQVPLHELKQPWIAHPQCGYYIAVNYYISGDDKLQPIAFTVKKATDILSALA